MTEEWCESRIAMGVDPDKYTKPPKGNGYTLEKLIGMGVLTKSNDGTVSNPQPEPAAPAEETVQDDVEKNTDISGNADFYIGDDGTITVLEPLPGGFGSVEYF